MWKHIETYIETHRSDLDRDTPPPDIWNKIEEELEEDQRRASGRIVRFGALDNWMRLAAAIVLILGGAWLWVQVIPQQPQQTTSLLPVVHTIQDAGADWEKAEASYLEEITLITGKLAVGWESSELYHQLRPELDRLERELNDIRRAHSEVFQKDSLLDELRRKQDEHLHALRSLLEE